MGLEGLLPRWLPHVAGKWCYWQVLSCGYSGAGASTVLHVDLPGGFLDFLTACQLRPKRKVEIASLLKGWAWN